MEHLLKGSKVTKLVHRKNTPLPNYTEKMIDMMLNDLLNFQINKIA